MLITAYIIMIIILIWICLDILLAIILIAVCVCQYIRRRIADKKRGGKHTS